MKILLVSTYFPPQNAAGSLRAYGFARYWAEAGADVTVLTAAKLPGQDGLDVARDGFRVVEIPYRIPRLLDRLRRRGLARALPRERSGARAAPFLGGLSHFRRRTGIFQTVRMPDLTDFWVGPARTWARTRGPWDVVVSTSGPYTVHLVAKAVKEEGLAGIWAADFRDLWTDNHAYRGLFPFTIFERQLERRCLESADLLTTVSKPLAARLSELSSKPVSVIYNGHDPELTRSLPAEKAFPEDGKQRIVFTGGVYPRGQDLRLLFEALQAAASRPPAGHRLRLVLAGGDSAIWRRWARDFGVARLLEDQGFVSRTRALHLQRDADALLLLDWKDEHAGVLTSKLFEYLFGRAPIIAVGGNPASGIGEILERSGRGIHVGRDKVRLEELLHGIAARNPPAVGPPDAKFIGRFTRRTQSLRYLELLEACAGGRPLDPSGSKGVPAGAKALS